MNDTLTVLQNLVAAAFLVLGLLAAVEWRRRPGPARGYQAIAIGLLALVSVVGRIQATLLPGATLLSYLAVIGFMGSGFALLLFRGVLLPLRRGWKIGAAWACALPVAGFVVVGLPQREVTPTSAQSVLVSVLFVVWLACVTEPIGRFWLASRGRPAVQRARLRALSLGYAGLVAIIAVSGLTGVAAQNGSVQIGVEIVALSTVPFLWAAFSPPLWLRRVWRSGEEEALRRSMQDLVLFTPDRNVLAARALEWATRLVGGYAAYISEADESILARQDISEERVAEINSKVAGLTQSDIVTIDADTVAITVPIQADDVKNRIVVISGPLTPVFGSDEVQRLDAYATAISLGLGRARFTERLTAVERAKTAFLNLASHELRGPLTVIHGYLTMIADGDFGRFPELEKTVIPALLRQSEQMSLLVEQMIETARLEDDRLDLHFAEVDIGELVAGVVSDTQSLLPAAITLSLSGSTPAPAIVNADRERVRTILANLIDNAIKYSPGGGDVACSLRADAGLILVDVSDRGVGIPEDQRHRLFTRFGRIVTADNAHIGGTGLGLYLCRELARRQSGDITVKARDGGGTIFTLTLPAWPESGAADSAAAAAAAALVTPARLARE